MRKEMLVCDLCGAEQDTSVRGISWERSYRSAEITTATSSSNPMAKWTEDEQHQDNTFTLEHLCYECQRKLAKAISVVIGELKQSK